MGRLDHGRPGWFAQYRRSPRVKRRHGLRLRPAARTACAVNTLGKNSRTVSAFNSSTRSRNKMEPHPADTALSFPDATQRLNPRSWRTHVSPARSSSRARNRSSRNARDHRRTPVCCRAVRNACRLVGSIVGPLFARHGSDSGWLCAVQLCGPRLTFRRCASPEGREQCGKHRTGRRRARRSRIVRRWIPIAVDRNHTDAAFRTACRAATVCSMSAMLL